MRFYPPKRGIRFPFWLPPVLLLAAAAGFLMYKNALKHRAKLEFTDLAQAVHTAASTAPTAAPSAPAETDAPEAPAEKTPLPQYLWLYEENPDFYGWLQIEGTAIDYPVMYTPEEPEKYLYRSFSGNPSTGGTLFLDGNCTPDGDNTIIYGHNMKDGSMFRDLLQYEREEFWEAHPVIRFDTLYEKGEYEVMAAFYDRVYYEEETCFKFYEFFKAEDEADYREAIRNYLGMSLYDTEIIARYGDKLLTLVTCAYQTENGRFVVVAKKK